jgi:4-amino-4-deoxy-L-arabinose transferase-like glycosyltransferase
MKYKHVVFFSLFLFSFFSILFHTNIPVIWPDEVLFFSPAFELGINGIMRTNVLNGLIPGMDTHTLWMPPAYIILLSGVFQFFPTELLTARLFSSFISLGSILLVYRICLQYQFSFKRTSLVLLLLASDFLFLKFSHTARMESLCLFFALLAFYFILGNAHVPLRRDLINQVLTKGDIATIPTSFDIFLSGICLSFSFLSHPFGIVHSIPVLFLLYQRNALTIQNLALYSFAGLLPIAAWGVYVVPNWELFIVQFGAQLSRKKKGSKNRRKANLHLNRVFQRIDNLRHDFFFKLAHELTDKYDVIFFEDLNLKGMKALWGRKVSDLCFGTFLNILQYVAGQKGVKIHFIDRFYPSSKTCSDCGYIYQKLSLKERQWACPGCGVIHDRDFNAALNIHRVGASTFGVGEVRLACQHSPLIPESHDL